MKDRRECGGCYQPVRECECETADGEWVTADVKESDCPECGQKFALLNGGMCPPCRKAQDSGGPLCCDHLALRWLGDDVKLRAFGRVFIAVLLFAATPAAFAASPLCVDAVDMEYGNTSTTRPKYALSVCESVRKLARAYGVRESLAVAVASYESDFKPWAISHAGAVGPMQVKPAYHCPPFLGIRICKSRAEFTQSGVAHLAELLDDYSEPVALASYNAGRRGASRGLGVRYSETVRRIEGRL